MWRVDNSYTVVANGNNLRIAADNVRRTILCRLDPKLEDPATKQFNSDPVATVLKDRGRYISDVLTISRAYIVASCPGKLPPRPSYERWSNLVRSGLVWLGRPDPVDTVETIQSDDPHLQERRAVFTAWVNELETESYYQTFELVRLASESGPGPTGKRRPELWDALLAVAYPNLGGPPAIDARLLGIWFRDNRDTVVNVTDKDGVVASYQLASAGKDVTRPRWHLVSLT